MIRDSSLTLSGDELNDVWNSIDESIIACDSINGFKGRIVKFVYGRGFIEAYQASFPLNNTILHYTLFLTFARASQLFSLFILMLYSVLRVRFNNK